MPRTRSLLPKCPTYRASCGDTQLGIPMMPDGGTQSRRNGTLSPADHSGHLKTNS
jgi:hypothetical protein